MSVVISVPVPEDQMIQYTQQPPQEQLPQSVDQLYNYLCSKPQVPQQSNDHIDVDPEEVAPVPEEVSTVTQQPSIEHIVDVPAEDPPQYSVDPVKPKQPYCVCQKMVIIIAMIFVVASMIFTTVLVYLNSVLAGSLFLSGCITLYFLLYVTIEYCQMKKFCVIR